MRGYVEVSYFFGYVNRVIITDATGTIVEPKEKIRRYAFLMYLANHGILADGNGNEFATNVDGRLRFHEVIAKDLLRLSIDQILSTLVTDGDGIWLLAQKFAKAIQDDNSQLWRQIKSKVKPLLKTYMYPNILHLAVNVIPLVVASILILCLPYVVSAVAILSIFVGAAVFFAGATLFLVGSINACANGVAACKYEDSLVSLEDTDYASKFNYKLCRSIRNKIGIIIIPATIASTVTVSMASMSMVHLVGTVPLASALATVMLSTNGIVAIAFLSVLALALIANVVIQYCHPLKKTPLWRETKSVSLLKLDDFTLKITDGVDDILESVPAPTSEGTGEPRQAEEKQLLLHHHKGGPFQNQHANAITGGLSSVQKRFGCQN